ncbi:wall-associated receptor kinase 3 isoform X2 [Arabidopsis lyrata subsp. lyrata]|uniref:wall-associated receptor kinase 3 isoform X2 n=1 Tax=Arabidopsis lyrata subsp. lyrata TaxID=81972 RepID=UPI000A29A7DA|nr:wall-associated receptor kinase 3 isoform X2 [Arabidopsis lyrata subsp. lyrata]|eukprot:XP_020869471.1 wall-associated receptor kinase 3 isoform X2 [Arabidopsis lyrata subsp. lyrata]
MKLQEGVSLVAIFFSLAYTQLVKGQHQPRDDCQTKCGNIKIEYPFGIASGCYYPGDDSFNLTCDEKEKLFIGINVEVVNFNDSAQLSVLFYRFSECIDEQSNETNGTALEYQLGGSFSFSSKNKFTLVGCNALALLNTFGKQNYSTGCLSLCDSQPEANEIRNGVGFCQTDVFDGYKVQFGSARLANQINHSLVYTSVYQFNPCTYAFLVEDGKFDFSATEDLRDLRNVTDFPVALDWSIGNQTCEQAGSTSICGGNSTCFDSTTRPGYVCKCKGGYHGNPYHPDGCQDIDECIIDTHNCSDPKTCKNKDGGFDCKCPSGYNLITTIHSTMKCTRPEYIRRTQSFLVTTIGFLVLLLRRQFFEQNGGGMLIQQISRVGSSNIDFKIFTEESMKEATNGYDESRILGQGGQGTVYKGILPDNSTVAIKKARLGDRSQVDQFVHEMIVLSQINHRNVVKLLGCCLETEFPLLVYEFITSGTLFDHLHGSMFDSSLTWEHRLRIAIEVAGTLAYLHSAASVPIIHRDVKTANILLDENLTAKVADFGASKLIPMDKEQLTTMVQGTLGYLDPEYYTTGLLNEKSDVYSFGVVLMELLSGEKALCFERPETSKHLVSYFASATKENRLHEIIDGQVMNEDNEREIQKAARIAAECTRIMGEERPRMKEVAVELESLSVKTTKHKWSDQNLEENEHLLGGHIVSAQGHTSSRGYDSIKNVASFDIEAGR